MPSLDLSVNCIDVRDIIERVEHLRQLRQHGPVDMGDDNGTDQDTLFAELSRLETILSELKGGGGDEQWEGDWYPVTLIYDGYFEDAMDELLEDIGAMPKDIPPYLKIIVDYDMLRTDYTSVEIEGATYWYR